MKISKEQMVGVELLLSATKTLSTKDRAYILATAWHETAQTMRPIRERGNAAYFAKYEAGTPIGKRLGNTVAGDGLRFIGRGFCQITGRRNYALFSKLLGIDLLVNPDQALLPTVAAQIIIKGMLEGLFTGKKLSDYSDFVSMRRIINGTDRAELIASYAVEFEKLVPTLVASQSLSTPTQIPTTTSAPGKGDLPPQPKSKGLLTTIIEAIMQSFRKKGT
jgi:putative chitinase